MGRELGVGTAGNLCEELVQGPFTVTVVRQGLILNSPHYRLTPIYLSIYWTYIIPLQGNYSEVLPVQAGSKRRVLRSLWKEVERVVPIHQNFVRCWTCYHLTCRPVLKVVVHISAMTWWVLANSLQDNLRRRSREILNLLKKVVDNSNIFQLNALINRKDFILLIHFLLISNLKCLETVNPLQRAVMLPLPHQE